MPTAANESSDAATPDLRGQLPTASSGTKRTTPDLRGRLSPASRDDAHGNGPRPYGLADAFSKPYRFCLGNAGATTSPLEQDLTNSTKPYSYVPYAPTASTTAANDAPMTQWYQNFD